ncbi:hypothetical protein B0I32_1314 [Nonomuraea fuscirosea]|uniref:Uncharacterized protein n=1 Tax=Nonomuraea fuscirosea TaxID=1291556 RepID=A0A2T0M545_9ACTN|nr:hypothetical protein B0I32_1314 [Nonomuraea fuscirosea]
MLPAGIDQPRPAVDPLDHNNPGRRKDIVAANRRRRRRDLPGRYEWGPLIFRAILIVVDWFVNGNGSK